MCWALEASPASQVRVACTRGQRAARETGNVVTQICLLNVRERRGVSTGTDGFGI